MDAVMAWLEGANHWGWWIFGIVLIVLEVAAPGAVFMWMGIAAGIVGFAVFFVPDLNWEYQFLIFAVLSVVSILVARRYLKARPIETDQPSLNRRGSQYIGRFFTLAEPIVAAVEMDEEPTPPLLPDEEVRPVIAESVRTASTYCYAALFSR